ncbi:hypothetical protein SAMN04488107_0419 [Geodermatophilus saharensis]|uniref:Uncharacterized protein n=1 Tax=Geodermatophilus saharensis TaxID=1137994 RepID=A0A238ZZR0_9ACTN|nr:hypothetical protein [Geodermatophilus saharensis]SNR88123.1 hypothetical protein SAMN04488107_0419 [Geodermatophilus saharensis]
MVGLGHLAEADGDLTSAGISHRRAWQTTPGHAAALEGLVGAAAAWRQRRHRPASRLERADAERAERRARAQLGDQEFDVESTAGASRPDAVAGELDGVAAQR